MVLISFNEKKIKLHTSKSVNKKGFISIRITQFDKLVVPTYCFAKCKPWWEKKGNLVMRFVGNLTTWREILTFDIKKYIRNGGKCNYIPGKNAFFQTLMWAIIFCERNHLLTSTEVWHFITYIATSIQYDMHMRIHHKLTVKVSINFLNKISLHLFKT